MASNAWSTHIYSAWSAFKFKMRNSGRHVDNAWAWPWQIYGLEKMITTSQALLEETRFGCVTKASYMHLNISIEHVVTGASHLENVEEGVYKCGNIENVVNMLNMRVFTMLNVEHVRTDV